MHLVGYFYSCERRYNFQDVLCEVQILLSQICLKYSAIIWIKFYVKFELFHKFVFLR
jgi:hypothetical protein